MLKWNTDNTFANPYWILQNKLNEDEKNRFQGMFSVKWNATEYSDNQIMNVDLTPSSGYSSRKMNAGKLQNRGVEVQLNATPVETPGGFSWDVIFMFPT
ncbi:MAG: hypothetical protein ACK5HT_13310 [Draconibacterium sp.]